jgi:ornithine cyclodeaminase
MEKIELLFLSQDDVKKTAISMTEVIQLVEEVLKAHGEHKVMMPPKSVTTVPGGEKIGRWNTLPGYVQPINMAGVKWASAFSANPSKKLPYQVQVNILNDGETGLPVAILDGSWITALRTGGISAIGASYLAKKQAKTLGMIGTGFIARLQLLALSEVIKFERVKVTDVRTEVAKTFAIEMSEKLEVDVITVENAKKASEDSDVILTLTTHFGNRFLREEWVDSGSLVMCFGQEEITADLARNVDKIVVDEMSQSMYRGNIGGLIKNGEITPENIFAELPDIILGRKPGREYEEERIIFCPMGMATEDVAVGKNVWEKAKKMGIGTKLVLREH